jgi:predicted dehydrogenase
MGNSPDGIGVLVVGYGGMGRVYARAFREICDVVGVVVRKDETVERLKAEVREPVFNDLEAALDATSATAVAVFSPTEWHALHVRWALRHRLPTMVIKPACVAPEVAEALHEETTAADMPLLMAHEGVFAPAFLAMEAAIEAGQIGEVQEIRWLKEGREQLSGGREKEAPRIEDREGRNYGHVYASVMHELYVVNRMLGRVAPTKTAVSECLAASHQMKLEALLEYPGGLSARIRYNLGADLPFRRGLQIVGEKGSLLWLVQPGRSTVQLRRGTKARDLGYQGRPGGPASDVVHAFVEMIRGAAPTETLLDGARALRAAAQVAVAAAASQGVEINIEGIAGGYDRSITG